MICYETWVVCLLVCHLHFHPLYYILRINPIFQFFVVGFDVDFVGNFDGYKEGTKTQKNQSDMTLNYLGDDRGIPKSQGKGWQFKSWL